MTLHGSKLITIIDELAEVRDLTSVALMAANDIGDREARNGFSRLLGLLCTQIDTIAEKLMAAHEGDSNDPA